MRAQTWLPTAFLVIVISASASAYAEKPADLSETIAEAKALWHSSCIEKDALEGCLVMRMPPLTYQCRGAQPMLRPGRRRQAMAARAQRSLTQSIERAAQEPQLATQHEAALAEARYLVAESAFATFLAIESPRGLNFSNNNPIRKNRSEARFIAFLTNLQDASARVASAYADVTNPATPPAIALAAITQTARMYRHYAQLLSSLEIPTDVYSGPFIADSIDAFCDAMHQEYEETEERARQLAELCIALSTDATSKWTTICKDLARPRNR